MDLIALYGGLVKSRVDGRTLFEIDPDFPVASRLRALDRGGAIPVELRRVFTQLVLHLRKLIEIGTLRRQIDPVSTVPVGAVRCFLFELHDNGLEYGSRDPHGRKNSGQSHVSCSQAVREPMALIPPAPPVSSVSISWLQWREMERDLIRERTTAALIVTRRGELVGERETVMTSRQFEVTRNLLASGMTMREIAPAVGVSVPTVFFRHLFEPAPVEDAINAEERPDIKLRIGSVI